MLAYYEQVNKLQLIINNIFLKLSTTIKYIKLIIYKCSNNNDLKRMRNKRKIIIKKVRHPYINVKILLLFPLKTIQSHEIKEIISNTIDINKRST